MKTANNLTPDELKNILSDRVEITEKNDEIFLIEQDLINRKAAQIQKEWETIKEQVSVCIKNQDFENAEQKLNSFKLYYPDFANTSLLANLLLTENNLRVAKNNKIKFAEPLITYDTETGFLFPYSITTIQGKKGQHKSRLAETIISVLLSDKEIIKLRRNNKYNTCVILIDTERNLKDQLPYAVQKILNRAELPLNENVENFRYTSLVEVERSKRYEAAKEFIELIRAENPNKHIVVVTDVITDFTNNFNDPVQSLQLSDYINNIINTAEASFICIIHENPGFDSTKARGHIGTELVNKASTVLKVGFVKESKDIIELKFLNTRNIKEPESIYLKYSEELKGLDIVNDYNTAIETITAKEEDIYEYLLKQIGDNDVIPLSDANKNICDYFKITERTAKDKISNVVRGANSIKEKPDPKDQRKKLLYKE